MLTTPARSENRPPSAARPIGTASSSVAAIVEELVSACWPLMTRTTEKSTTMPANSQVSRRARPPPVSRSVSGPRLGRGPLSREVATVLMPGSPRKRGAPPERLRGVSSCSGLLPLVAQLPGAGRPALAGAGALAAVDGASGGGGPGGLLPHPGAAVAGDRARRGRAALGRAAGHPAGDLVGDD